MSKLEEAVLDMLRQAGRSMPLQTIYRKIQPRASSGAEYNEVLEVVGRLVDSGKVHRETRGDTAHYSVIAEPVAVIKPRKERPADPEPTNGALDAQHIVQSLRNLAQIIERASHAQDRAKQLQAELDAAEDLASEAEARRIAAESERDALRAERDALKARFDKLSEALRG